MIRRKVFEQSGESYGGAEAEKPPEGKTVFPKSSCPGESACAWFFEAAGETHEARERNACTGGDKEKPLCPYFKSKPKQRAAIDVKEDLSIAAEVEKMVSEISDIVFWEDAGDATDWRLYPFETRMLYGIWREAEKQVTRIQNGRMQTFIKGFWGS